MAESHPTEDLKEPSRDQDTAENAAEKEAEKVDERAQQLPEEVQPASAAKAPTILLLSDPPSKPTTSSLLIQGMIAPQVHPLEAALKDGLKEAARVDVDPTLLHDLKITIGKPNAGRPPAVEQEAEEEGEPVNTKTHKQAYMRLKRFMEGSDAARFPHMQKLWDGSTKEKNELLSSWVKKNENRAACESAVVMQRESVNKYNATQQLMSVQEMVDRKFPTEKIRSIIHRGGGVPDADAPDCLMLTQFWVTVSRTKSAEESQSTRASTSVECETDMNVFDAPLATPSAIAPHRYISDVQKLMDAATKPVDPTAQTSASGVWACLCT